MGQAHREQRDHLDLYFTASSPLQPCRCERTHTAKKMTGTPLGAQRTLATPWTPLDTAMNTNTETRFRHLAAAAVGLLLIATLHAQVPNAPSTEPDAIPAAAGVRIVRLSESRGEVKMDRNVGHGFEAAFQNLPIVQGAKLKTDQGVAEVEFEDNSTLRLTPDAVVEFSKLSRDASGSTVTSVNVLHGTVYASLSDAHTNTFLISSAHGSLALAPSTHMQFRTGAADSALAVYKGSVQAQVGSSLMTVDQKKTLNFGPAGVVQPQLVSHIEKGAYDDWDKTSVDYHKRYMNSFQTSGNAYGSVSGVSSGLSDLNYYGSFSDIGGCGNLWRPYFTDASFDPYANGIYAQYAGGYSWVSPYPWGWLPYHSGSWQYCQGGGGGWGWSPGSTYVGLANTRMPIKPKQGPVRVGPPHPPVLGSASLVPIQRQPVVVSKLGKNDNFVFAKGSAGIGIPRQTFGNLQHAALHAEQHGSASASIPWSRAESTGFASSGNNRSLASNNSRSTVSTGRSAGAAAPSFSSASSSAISSHSSGGFGGGSAASAGGGASHH